MDCPAREMAPVWTQSCPGQSESETRTLHSGLKGRSLYYGERVSV